MENYDDSAQDNSRAQEGNEDVIQNFNDEAGQGGETSNLSVPQDLPIDNRQSRQFDVREYDVIDSPDMEKKVAVREDEDEQQVYELNCPRVNCSEKIVICLDFTTEMEKMIFRSRAGEKLSPLKLVKRALSLFLQTKYQMDMYHEFALVVLQDSPTWVCDFTSSPREILSALDDLGNTASCETFDLAMLFDLIREKVSLPTVKGDQAVIPPPYIVRVLLIYGRSHCTLENSDKESWRFLESSSYFFVDAFYIHEPPSEENKCEEIFDKLCDLDQKGLSYILEAAQNPTKVYNCMAQLLGHPLQRPLQKCLSHKIQTPTPVDDQR